MTNVHIAFEYLQSLDLSPEDHLPDNEDFISSGSLVILSPKGEADRDNEENLGDENELLFKQK